MTLAFALFLDLDPSDTSPLVAALTPAWLADCAVDVQNQLRTEVAAYWPDGATAMMRVASGPADIVTGEIAFAICSALANAPGAEAYHDVGGNAVPVAFLALDTCSSLDDVSSGISHECVETAGDSECNLFADNTDGKSYARELCDAVQASGYRGKCGLQLSDFVLPAFFAPTATTGPFRFLATQGQPDLPGPFATQAGGYQIVRVQGETQVSGSLARIAKATASRSRMHRRGVRKAL